MSAALGLCFCLVALAAGLPVRHHVFSDPQGRPGRASEEPYKTFAQPIDHFDTANTETFLQRYLVNDTFWAGDGHPIFVILGGEGALGVRTVGGRFVSLEWAGQMGALVVAVEHRYYGKSVPKGTLETGNLRFLSSEQALADFARFITAMVKAYNAPTSKVVTFGGSYSGALSAWMRLKHPDVVYAAVASSAPVLAQEDFAQYLEVVATGLRTQGSQFCPSLVGAAMDHVQAQLDLGPTQRAEVAKSLMACTTPESRSDDATLIESITDSFATYVQYNRDNNGLLPYNVDGVCKFFESAATPQEGLFKFIADHNSHFGNNCTESAWKQSIAELSNTDPSAPGASGRSWYWQTCTEFGYFQTVEEPPLSPFLPILNLEFFTEVCRQVYGINPAVISANVRKTNAFYGGKALKSSRIVLPNGSVDPWHVLGITDSVDPQMPSVFIQGTAHCADLYAPSEQDLPALTQARAKILATLSQWLSN